MTGAPVVCIVDDDESVRESLTGLFRSIGFLAHPFSSAEEYLATPAGARGGCLILDVTMPGMSGASLQELLVERREAPPIVFITARTEEALHQRLLARGAIACLVNPFHEDALLDAVRKAIDTATAES